MIKAQTQIILIIVFLLSAVLMVIGSNILVRLMSKVYPEEHYIRMRPPKRLIKKLKTEKATDRELIKNLKLGLTLETLD